MDILGVGGWDIFIIIIIALLIYGPERIVGIARNLGKIARTLKNSTSDLSATIAREIEAQEKAKTTKATQSTSASVDISVSPPTTPIQSIRKE
jgi:Sec-independent protein translocase protein TatA